MRRRIKQVAVAEGLGHGSNTFLSRLELGHVSLTPGMARRLAVIYGTDVSAIAAEPLLSPEEEEELSRNLPRSKERSRSGRLQKSQQLSLGGAPMSATLSWSDFVESIASLAKRAESADVRFPGARSYFEQEVRRAVDIAEAGSFPRGDAGSWSAK